MNNNCPFCAKPMDDSGAAFEQVEGADDGERYFEEDRALAVLFANEVLFVNAPHWRTDWPEEARQFPVPLVNCNDVFAWGHADGEMLPYAEIENLWTMWRKDSSWGPAVWCIQRRKRVPQKPVEDAIREAGIWNLDSMGLLPNREARNE